MLRLLRSIYGVYAALTFVVVVLILFCPLIIIAPTLPLRRALGRVCVRSWLATSFIRFQRRGFEHLPAGACIAACNHASYIDGMILTAALPGHFSFLVQHGAADWPYIGLVLKRMGAHFVDRGSTRAAALITRELIARLQAGESLAIFPEGTFRAKAELRPFQMGTFLIAARAQVPVVPIVLHGTRKLFGEGQRLFRHSHIELECYAPVLASGSDRDAARALQSQVRAVMLQHCREEDGAIVGDDDDASGNGNGNGNGNGDSKVEGSGCSNGVEPRQQA